MTNPTTPAAALATHSATAQPRYFALIACAGVGARAGLAWPKQYQPLVGKPLVLHTLAAFVACPALAGVLVVVAPGDDFFSTHALPGVAVADVGGATRALTVQSGLAALRVNFAARDSDWVLVHDAARCLITPQQIQALITACQGDAVGGLLAQPLADTLKQTDPNVPNRAAATVARTGKWLAQTPQMFKLGLLDQALASAQEYRAGQRAEQITDEASAVEALGFAPLLVDAGGPNLKVTFAEDFAVAQAILLARGQA